MKYGMDSLNELVEILQRKRLKYRDNVIIGDNSSGKSLLLKMIIENYGVTNDLISTPSRIPNSSIRSFAAR